MNKNALQIRVCGFQLLQPSAAMTLSLLVVLSLLMTVSSTAKAQATGGLTLNDATNLSVAAHRTETDNNESQNPDITGGLGGYPAGFDPYSTGANFDCCGTEFGAGNLRDNDVGANFAYGRYSDGSYAIPKAGKLTLNLNQPRLLTGIAIYNGYTNRDDGTYRLLDGWGQVLGSWTISTPAGEGSNSGADSFWLRFKNPVMTDKLVLETTSTDLDATNSYREIVVLHDGPIALRGITVDDVYTVSWPASSAWQGDAGSTESPGHLVRQNSDRWLQLNADRQVMATYDKREERQFMVLLEGDGHLLEVDFDRMRIQKRHAGGAVRWTRKIHEVTTTPDPTDYQRYVPAVEYSAKGGDVTYVSYGDKSELGARRYEGHFEQLPDQSWRHMSRPHQGSRNFVETERFSETGRDEWSVYLVGSSASNTGVRVTLNLWLKTVKRGDETGDITGASNTPLPTPEELAQMAEIARQEEESNYDRMLQSPVSKDDLNKVMHWIGQETATESVGFCYRNSTPRQGYPWAPGDPALPGGYSTMIERCEGEHGAGQCALEVAVVYPKCEAGFYGDGPICWQSCPTYHDVMATGQNVKFDCGTFCATNRDECAMGVKEMVFAPINLALNILSMGLAGLAQNSAAAAGQQAIEASLDAVQYSTAFGQAAQGTAFVATGGGAAIAAQATAVSTIAEASARATIGSVLKEAFQFGASSLADNIANFANVGVVDILADVATIAGETTAAFSSIEAAIGGIQGSASGQALELIDEVGVWSADYAKQFREHTSPRVDRLINQHFTNADDRAYIKQKFGQYQIAGMIAADGWETADTVLGVLSFEPVGVISLIAAFAHPVCRDAPAPFPAIRILPNNERQGFDPMTRAP